MRIIARIEVTGGEQAYPVDRQSCERICRRRSDKPPVFFSLPLHVAERNGIVPGVTATVSLLADSIHLMKPDRLGRSRR